MPPGEEISARFKAAEKRKHKQQAQVAQCLLIARREGDKTCITSSLFQCLGPHDQGICLQPARALDCILSLQAAVEGPPPLPPKI